MNVSSAGPSPGTGYRQRLVGDILETAIRELLTRHGISYRKTKRAQRVQGFEQAPDFIVPNEFNPQVIIEAKIAEDDGTARDKVTRVQHLHTLSMRGHSEEQGPAYGFIKVPSATTVTPKLVACQPCPAAQ